MKVGIITQPLRTNYGGILQNYALQQILLRNGHEPITLDYSTRYTPYKWILGEIKALVKGSKHNVEYPKYFRAGQKNLNKFITKYIKTTRPYYHLPLKRFAKEVDSIIVGSDQVWRPLCNVPEIWLYEMFLESIEDVSLPKIAYAASFGSEEWEYNKNQTLKCAELIKAFKAVSTREDSGVKLCRDFLGYQAEHVLDPTMLLEGGDYEIFTQAESNYSKPTLFVYLLDPSDEKITQIKEIAKAKNLELFVKGANDDIERDDSIERWLSWIKNAKYVVTDSFHGAVFSILFHRPFNVYLESWRGAARFNSLLNLTHCKSRGIISGAATCTSEEIDWLCIDNILSDYREKSIDFIVSNLSI